MYRLTNKNSQMLAVYKQLTKRAFDMKRLMLAIITLFITTLAFTEEKRIVIPEANLDFVANDDFTEVTITKFKNAESFQGKSIELPSEIQGIPVTAIMGGIPSNQESHYKESFTQLCLTTEPIEEIFIPDSVKTIGDGAFYWANVKKVRLPSELKVIESKTFMRSNIETITLYSSVEIIGTDAFVDSHLKSITIPSSVKTIYAGAFENCTMLESVSIPASVVKIGAKAFHNTGIKILEFPPTRIYFSGFHNDFFNECNNLEKIIIPDGFDPLAYEEATLDDFIKGEKISKSIALQKQLRRIEMRSAWRTYLDEVLAKYDKSFATGDFDEAQKIMIKFINSEKLGWIGGCSYYYKNREYNNSGLPYIVLFNAQEAKFTEVLNTGNYEEAEKLASEYLEYWRNKYDWRSREEKCREFILKARLPDIEKQINGNGKLTENEDGTLDFITSGIELVFSEYDREVKIFIEDSFGNSFQIKSDIFLEELNKFTDLKYKISKKGSYGNYTYTLIRPATDEEIEAYKKQQELSKKQQNDAKILEAFNSKKLTTNISKWYEFGTKYDNDGEIISRIEKDSIFFSQGLQKKDIIKKISFTDAEGKTKNVKRTEFDELMAPGTLTFTILRGKKKNQQELKITIPVEWKKYELERLGLE